MSKVNIKIEGIPYQVDAGLTILEAAKQCGYDIPTLCTFNHGECNQGSCRVCLVEVQEGKDPSAAPKKLVASCVYPVSEGMIDGGYKLTAFSQCACKWLKTDRCRFLRTFD